MKSAYQMSKPLEQRIAESNAMKEILTMYQSMVMMIEVVIYQMFVDVSFLFHLEFLF